MSVVEREIADERGPAGPPRKNGERVFTAPWEGRAFGMALALRAHQPYPWEELRALLERRIKAAGPEDDGSQYYELWVASLEELLGRRGLLDEDELERRTEEYLAGRRDEVF
ncbi:MAG TPA: nitrile hydratase accessory protein [Candidatus Dormibacteraeota bacterium]